MQAWKKMEPHGQNPWYLPFFGGIRRSIPSFAQGFGGLSFSHSSTAKSRGLLRRQIKVTNRGFTLIETIIVLLILAILLGVSSFLFVVSLRAWSAGYIRAGIREDVSYAMEKVVRDLKEIAHGSLIQYSSIANTIEYREFRPSEGEDTCVFYLYNSADSSFDSSYTESHYNLYKANTTHGDNPALGEGTLILRDLVSPDATAPATALTISGTQVTLDFVIQRSDEIVRIRTKVRPRNL